MLIKKVAKFILPKSFQPKAKQIYYKLISGLYVGDNVYCCCCEKTFKSFAKFDYENEYVCPGCGSFRRHRLLFSYLKNKTDFYDKKIKLLDIAPLFEQQEFFKEQENISYLSADLMSPFVMEHFDLTNIPHPDNSFDVIICEHVLEHIEDDSKAISEMYRILRPGGWAILQSPIDYERETTYEDFSIQSPKDRLKYFGQEDHVRIYGRDYPKRLEMGGFRVVCDDYISSFALNEIESFGFDSTEIIYLCFKD